MIWIVSSTYQYYWNPSIPMCIYVNVDSLLISSCRLSHCCRSSSRSKRSLSSLSRSGRKLVSTVGSLSIFRFLGAACSSSSSSLCSSSSAKDNFTLALFFFLFFFFSSLKTCQWIMMHGVTLIFTQEVLFWLLHAFAVPEGSL